MPTKTELIDRLEEVRKAKELPKAHFGPEELEVAAVTYRKWTYSETEPSGENMLKILDYLKENERIK